MTTLLQLGVSALKMKLLPLNHQISLVLSNLPFNKKVYQAIMRTVNEGRSLIPRIKKSPRSASID